MVLDLKSNLKNNNIDMKTPYQQAKSDLKEVSKVIKKEYKSDKPAQRMHINDYCDSLCKDYQFSNYYSDLLSSYSCTLHPKN